MRSLVAATFRNLFKIRPLRRHYFGVQEALFSGEYLKGLKKKVTNPRGPKLFLHLDDWIPQQLYFLGTYEEPGIRFLEKTLKEDDVFIDIGANIGWFSLVASNLVGRSGQVIAFEPYSTNFDRLQENIALNNAENITVERRAITDREREIELSVDLGHRNLGMVSEFSPRNDHSEKVMGLSLDSFFDNRRVEKIALIKIDIEGGEFAAVKGMARILDKFSPVLLVEVNSTDYRPADMIDFLRDLNYQPHGLREDGAPKPSWQETGDTLNLVFLRGTQIISNSSI